MRLSTVGTTTPYQFFGTFAGLPFWAGGLTLLAAEPGVGKTSWLLRMLYDAARHKIPAALGCYEHTEEELKFRMMQQSAAALAGPHAPVDDYSAERHLADAASAVLLSLSARDDTIRSIEDVLLSDYGFPVKGPALVAVDYVQRIPVVGPSGLIPDDLRAGEAAAALRILARRHDWAIIAASALQKSAFGVDTTPDLASLLGDERLPYEADRVYLLSRTEAEARPCGCFDIRARTLKDRTGPVREFRMEFWGARFYPASEDEAARYKDGHQ